MKSGDYVRTCQGQIFKWCEYDKIREELEPDFFDEDGDFSIFYKNDILKSSPNIIDLIKVGDYVNGCMVINKKDDIIQIIQLVVPFDLKEKDIKSIVTKEQFESMEYKIK